jgi:hypothetical protein
MADPSLHVTGSSRFAVPLPYIQLNGQPIRLTGRRASFHTLVFFFGAAGVARAALNIAHPSGLAAYVAAYAASILAGMIIGAVIRAKKDDRLSRLWSSTFALIGFDAASWLAANTVHTPAASPLAAGYVPIAATILVVCFTLGNLIMVRYFPGGQDPTV